MPDRKGERRRAEILAAARRVLVAEGYDRFVLREIAARVGIMLGNLQYYFATRDDLLEAVIRAEFARNQAEVAAITGRREPAADRLAAVTRHLIAVWAREGGRVYAAMSFLALHQPRFRRVHAEIYAAFYRSLLPLLRELRPGAARAELLDAARLVTTVIDGALVQPPSRRFVAAAVAAVGRLAAAPPALGCARGRARR
jgi:AcrR family transcriptional regulator